MKTSMSPSSTHAPGLIGRRAAAAALVAAPALWLGPRAQPGPAPRATPAQTEGPFYPDALPKDIDYDLLRNGDLNYPEGQPTWLEGSVHDLAGQPVKGAQVEIWQCDGAGQYHHAGDGGRADKRFQGFGRITTDALGSYRFRTIRPVAYSGRTPHIHLKVRLGSRALLTTQLYVAGEPGNTRDFLWRGLSPAERALLTAPFVPGPDGMRALFPLVVAA